MLTSNLKSIHHEALEEAPIAVRILNRLIIGMGAALTVTAFVLFYAH